MSTGTLDTNVLDATAAEFTVTTETFFTLYVVDLTGDHANHRVTLEVSPDGGTNWLTEPNSVLGHGCMSIGAVTTKLRAKVVEADGAVSTATVHILGA